MPKYEQPAQFEFDPRTGLITAIFGPGVGDPCRAACSALNRERARGLLEAINLTPPGKSLSPDVWTSAFARKAREWHVPLIPLRRLGISHDRDGFRESAFLTPLSGGAEAFAYLDKEFGVVYKLFFVSEEGALGKKLSFEADENGVYDLKVQPARLQETIEKLELLHELGAHPTEIVGLSDFGDYLIAKQPLAQEERYSLDQPGELAMSEFTKDREIAVERVRGMKILGDVRGFVIAAHLRGQNVLISDLHTKNIMRDSNGLPTIIDALIGDVSPGAYSKLAHLARACDGAKAWFEGRRPSEWRIGDGVEDSDL